MLRRMSGNRRRLHAEKNVRKQRRRLHAEKNVGKQKKVAR